MRFALAIDGGFEPLSGYDKGEAHLIMENITAAREFGMYAVLFRDTQQAIADVGAVLAGGQ